MQRHVMTWVVGFLIVAYGTGAALPLGVTMDVDDIVEQLAIPAPLGSGLKACVVGKINEIPRSTDAAAAEWKRIIAACFSTSVDGVRIPQIKSRLLCVLTNKQLWNCDKAPAALQKSSGSSETSIKPVSANKFVDKEHPSKVKVGQAGPEPLTVGDEGGIDVPGVMKAPFWLYDSVSVTSEAQDASSESITDVSDDEEHVYQASSAHVNVASMRRPQDSDVMEETTRRFWRSGEPSRSIATQTGSGAHVDDEESEEEQYGAARARGTRAAVIRQSWTNDSGTNAHPATKPQTHREQVTQNPTPSLTEQVTRNPMPSLTMNGRKSFQTFPGQARDARQRPGQRRLQREQDGVGVPHEQPSPRNPDVQASTPAAGRRATSDELLAQTLHNVYAKETELHSGPSAPLDWRAMVIQNNLDDEEIAFQLHLEALQEQHEVQNAARANDPSMARQLQALELQSTGADEHLARLLQQEELHRLHDGRL
ncbi:unnamed protein product (mitochondrion) [Plasmodiophora brassicae]|uniref:Secreted protein n=1 Tax=Plasmodiophora brassicae TaxID=37360 RepID=A0A3P3Y813_PLABS|nr:unnamed protein product [Plasmodiophora brassicae]